MGDPSAGHDCNKAPLFLESYTLLFTYSNWSSEMHCSWIEKFYFVTRGKLFLSIPCIILSMSGTPLPEGFFVIPLPPAPSKEWAPTLCYFRAPLHAHFPALSDAGRLQLHTAFQMQVQHGYPFLSSQSR